MRVFLTGGTGFLGRALVQALVAQGDTCIVVSRGPPPDAAGPVRFVRADPSRPGPWQEEAAHADAVVNLAGVPIVDPPHRWTPDRKEAIRASRIGTTRNLAEAIGAATEPPRAFLSCSAVGYYGNRGDAELDELAPPGDDFLARLAIDWERAAEAAGGRTRVVRLRTGIVLGRGGGALAPMLPVFRLGLGGPWGDGRGWWSWIHLADWVGLARFLLATELDGPVNLTAPNPLTVNEFAHSLGRALGRPAKVRMPAWALRLGLGEAADALLHLQRVVPRRALDAGYRFAFPTIDEALRDVVG